MMRNLFLCYLLYESDNLKAELEHENDKASSDDMSSEWHDGQDTIQVAAPRDVWPDEETLYSCLKCPQPYCYKHASSFPGQISNLGSQKISQALYFPGKAWPSAVVTMAGEKERGAVTTKS